MEYELQFQFHYMKEKEKRKRKTILPSNDTWILIHFSSFKGNE